MNAHRDVGRHSCEWVFVCASVVANTGSMPNASAAASAVVLVSLCFIFIDVENMDSF